MTKRDSARVAHRPPVIDWLYHHQHCESCRLARGFLEKHNLSPRTASDARVERFNRDAVLRMLRDVKRVIATRGRAIREITLDEPQVDLVAVADLLIGPSGNLRAPTLRIGRTLITGFSEPLYNEHVLRLRPAPSGPSH